MKRLLYISVLFVIILALFMIGCGEKEESYTYSYKDGVTIYLTQVNKILAETTELAYEITDLYENWGQYPTSEVLEKCNGYADRYENLTNRIAILSYPLGIPSEGISECTKLKEATIDAFSLCKLALQGFSAWIGAGGTGSINSVRSNSNRALNTFKFVSTYWEAVSYYANEEAASISDIQLLIPRFDRIDVPTYKSSKVLEIARHSPRIKVAYDEYALTRYWVIPSYQGLELSTQYVGSGRWIVIWTGKVPQGGNWVPFVEGYFFDEASAQLERIKS
ncbi:hypothetical protein ACFLU4_02690 [Chloroflexota bacterium]